MKNNVIVEDMFDIVRPSGETLQGTLVYRSDTNRVGPVIVYIHGTLSSGSHNFTTGLAHKLAKDHGIRSYRYNGRFSATEFEPLHRYKFSGYEDDISDMVYVISTLNAEGFKTWCILGHSRGA